MRIRDFFGASVLGLLLMVGAPAAFANTYVVKSAGDDIPNGTTPCTTNGNACTLRDAIAEANNFTGPHTINFAVPVVTLSNGGGMTISAPVIMTGPVVINGNNNACLTLSDATTAQNANGADGSTLTLLVIQNCASDAISANGHGHTISNNFIGTNAAGSSAAANHGYGISLSASRVYTTLNSSSFLSIYNALPAQPVASSDVANYMNGFATQFVTAIATLTKPVNIFNNVISGNYQAGIYIHSENLAAVIVTNNKIGTDATGNIAIPNGSNNGDPGILLNGDTFGNLIGPGNIISGNNGYGIDVETQAVFLPNFIMGNTIGLATTAGNHIGNLKSGIYVGSASPQSSPTQLNPSGVSLMVGPGNVISDNQGGSSASDPDVLNGTEAGIFITGGAATSGVKVYGNVVGMASFGGTRLNSSAYGNAGDGIRVTTGGNTIGGSSPAFANVVAANKHHGIVVDSQATGISIVGNSIGVDPSFAGVMTLGNAYDGIHLNHASATTIGGTGSTDGNTIAANGRNGVRVMAGGTSDGWGNLLQRNLIYGNAKSTAGVGIDLDYLVNATNPLHTEIPANNANLDQAQPRICLGNEGAGDACNGSTAAIFDGTNLILDWTVATHGPANFRVEFFSMDQNDNNTASTMGFLAEVLVSTDATTTLSSGSAGTTCSGSVPGVCHSIIPVTGAANVLATVTDISQITNMPGSGWQSQISCFLGLASCPVNNTSEYSNAVTPAALVPMATTTAASAVTASAATLNATVSANGASTTVSFEYGTTAAYGSMMAAAQSPVSANGAMVSAALTGLTCNTQYHFRVDATNGIGSNNGSDLTFTTAACPATAPSTTTMSASAIAVTGATLNGTVSANGASSTVNFEYGTTSAYGSMMAAAQSPVNTNGAAVSAAVTGLSCNTLYHFRVDATNGIGSNNGSDLTFTTSACPAAAPSATTMSASAIATSGATLNGIVSANSAPTTVTFEYGTSAAYGSAMAAAQSPVSTNGTAVTADVSGLTCGTQYHFRVDATNGIGSNNGSDLTFTTSACPAGAPSATTAAASAITSTDAMLNGMVSANGASTAATFDYGLTTAYGATVAAAQSPVSSNGTAVSASVTGLSCGSTYHFRANATNVNGGAHGIDMSFATSACAAGTPSATTAAATGVATTAATLNGTVSANGASTTVTFQYGTTAAYGSTMAAAQSPVNANGATVTAAVSGLTCGTLYHFRVDATNGVGSNNGSDLTFTTSACPAGSPTATTTAASAIATTGATLNGTVSANGASTTVTFEYGATAAYGSTMAAAQSPVSANGAAVSAAVTGLTCNTLYHFRVDATNGVGSNNGSDMTFTTSACPAGSPTATTMAASGIATTGATLNGTVSANGASTTVTFEYGTTAAYGSTMAAAQSPVNANGASVTAAISGLTCNTLYHFRVDATNGVGSNNGSDMTFTTSACPAGAPNVTTMAASGIATTSATLNGTVSANGASTTVTFEYGTTAAYGSSMAAAQSPVSTNGASVTATVSGLVCSTQYHFRVDATNGSGSNNGSDMTFTTSACPAGSPSATTMAASAIAATGATLNGTVSANGASTTVTFEYGTTAAYGSSMSAAQSPVNTNGASVTAAVGGLTCNTIYHFRVDATNGIGSNNGSDQTFATASCVVPVPVPVITTIPLLPATVSIPGISVVPAIVNMDAGAGPSFMTDLIFMLSNALGTQLQYVGQNALGTVTLSGFGGGNLAFVPSNFVGSGDNRGNGIYAMGDGRYQAVWNGQSLTIAPAMPLLNQLTGLFPGLSATLGDNGVIIATINGVSYVVQPSVAVQLTAATGSVQFGMGSDGYWRFVDTLGNSQILYPAFADPVALRNVLQGQDPAAILAIQLDGTASIVFNGQSYTLVPDITLSPVPAERVGQTVWQESATRYWVVNAQPQGTAQGFTVKP